MAMSKADVIALQKSLGVKADGIIGPNTIKAFQKKAGLKPDGIIGPKTIAAGESQGIYFKGSKGSNAVAAPSAQMSPPAIKSLQTAMGLKPDGIIGPKTIAAAKAKGINLPAPKKKATKAVKGKAAKIIPAILKPGDNVGGVDPFIGTRSEGWAPALAAIAPEAKILAAQQLRTLADSPNTTNADVQTLIQSLTASIAPQLDAISEVVAARNISTDATSESNAKLIEAQNRLDDAERWAKTQSAQVSILTEIKNLAQQLIAKDKITQRVFKAYGVAQ